MRTSIPMFVSVALIAGLTLARAADTDFNGRWDLVVHKVPADKAWWLEITGAGTPQIKGNFVGFPDGSLHDLADLKLENGVLRFAWDRPNNHIDYEVRYVNGVLEGQMKAPKETLKFTGQHAPAINEHDDGTWIKGKPVTLFNGSDLFGWAGLKSGLRGRYEVQILDDFGQPPGLHGTGALYTRIVPPENFGKPAGEWQTLDVRLVGMEVTGTLNGHKLYEKGVIDGLTGIAYDPYEGQPGAIELQGDHGAVQFRNITLTPLAQRKAGK